MPLPPQRRLEFPPCEEDDDEPVPIVHASRLGNSLFGLKTLDDIRRFEHSLRPQLFVTPQILVMFVAGTVPRDDAFWAGRLFALLMTLRRFEANALERRKEDEREQRELQRWHHARAADALSNDEEYSKPEDDVLDDNLEQVYEMSKMDDELEAFQSGKIGK